VTRINSKKRLPTARSKRFNGSRSAKFFEFFLPFIIFLWTYSANVIFCKFSKANKFNLILKGDRAMLRKILFISSVTLLFLCTPLPALDFGELSRAADVSAQLKQAAAYKDNRRYEQAEAIYQQIITASPDTNDALEAQKQLVLIYIAAGTQQQADAAFEKLVADFSKHKGIAEAVWQIAEGYGWPEEYNKAFQLHQYNVEHFPSDMYAMRSQTEIVYSRLRKGDGATTDAAIDKLLSVFSDQPTLPKEIYQITERYKKLGKNDKALVLHQYSVEHFPNEMYAMWSQVEIVYSHIRDGNEPAADAAFDKLVAVFSSQPTLPKEIYQIALKYNQSKRNDKALELHQHNAEHSSRDDMYTMWSQVEIIKSHIRDGNEPAADAGYDKLLAVFSGQPTLPKEIYQLANTYSNAGRNDKAGQLYQYILKTWPGDKYAMLAKNSLAGGTHLNDELSVKETVDSLLSDFSKNKDIAKSLSENVAKYYKAGSYEKVAQLCQYVINNWRDDAAAVICGKLELAKVRIAESNDVAVKAIMDELAAAYGGHTDLPQAIFQIGEEYYNKALNTKGEPNLPEARPGEYYQKALAVWERIIEELPDSNSTIAAHAHYFSAVCYRKLGKYEKAIEYFQKVVDRWPDYQYAWSAQCLIGECYEKLQSSGKLSASEAEPLIEQAYQAVIEKYPDCSLVGHACLKLSDMYLQKGDRDEADACLELFLAKAHPDDPRREMVKAKLEKLKGSGN
jgi:tetratricopeptide (TPR) repeat protein